MFQGKMKFSAWEAVCEHGEVLCVFLQCTKESGFLVLLGSGTLNVILLLFVVQCGKNIVEKMNLINTTAE